MTPDFAIPKAFPGQQLAGVTLAQVKQTNDPDGLGRITVNFQVAGALIESDWLQVMSFYGGPGYGAFFLPSEGQSVLVAFAGGNINQPFVLGVLWNGGIKPPVDGVERQQDVRVIKTRQGKQLIFDDSKEGQLTLIDEQQNKVQIDTVNKRIVVESKGDVSITAANVLTLKANQVVIQNTAGTVKLDLTAASLQANGGQSMKLSATMIEIN
ncbi:phage baseplate assembly protein V [Dyella tabacisoli]|uniref:Rhs element Vgr protein n=1 Tax=Dyella tabacisoli TaxID=2282381 RepID=A0A369USN6_9GAMM|nr:phage baseplate assembly protein V [Dyella tabacisoli]RDD81349.1 Rhs element Vgr protein [Dyella tabacisoli]